MLVVRRLCCSHAVGDSDYADTMVAAEPKLDVWGKKDPHMPYPPSPLTYRVIVLWDSNQPVQR
jgi:hypothetical protein